MSAKDSKRNKKYTNMDSTKDILKHKPFFDLYPSGTLYKGKAKDLKIKNLGPKKN